MPLYDIRCSQSGNIFERVIPLAKFEEPIICSCGAPAIRVISTPLFSVDNTSYQCPITGSYIGSKKDHRENLAKHDCRVLETGEKELNERQKAEAEQAFDKKIEDTVEREIDRMPSAKKEQLANELVNGKLDVAVERR
jgi:hypothetical protein